MFSNLFFQISFLTGKFIINKIVISFLFVKVYNILFTYIIINAETQQFLEMKIFAYQLLWNLTAIYSPNKFMNFLKKTLLFMRKNQKVEIKA